MNRTEYLHSTLSNGYKIPGAGAWRGCQLPQACMACGFGAVHASPMAAQLPPAAASLIR